MNLASYFSFDSFFLMMIPVAIMEGARVTRIIRLVTRRSRADGWILGAIESLLLLGLAATSSPWVFMGVGALRFFFGRWRDGHYWKRSGIKLTLMMVTMSLLLYAGYRSNVEVSFTTLGEMAPRLEPAWRIAVLAVLTAVCVSAILPVSISDEAHVTLTAPFMMIAFARVGVPLGVAEPQSAVIGPTLGLVLALISALWLLSAGMRANHFEHSTLVSELVLCERGVLLSFVWMGLATGERLAGVGAILEWWTAAFALSALEAALRVEAFPKGMAFFALAMAIGLPGTVGFVAEDLLAHGLLETRPLLATGFVMVVAINAVALYLGLTNLLVEVGPHRDGRPTAIMLVPAMAALLVGIVPRPFVDTAAAARAAVAAFHDDREEHEDSAQGEGAAP